MRKNFLKVVAIATALIGCGVSVASCNSKESDAPSNETESNPGGETKAEPKLTTTSITISVGDTSALAVNDVPSGANVIWASKNTAVCTVSDGVVTGVGAGSTLVTATVGDKVLNCSVTVTAVVHKYSVTYDANGGTGSITDDNEYTDGFKVTTAANTFGAPANKEFVCWNTKADGSGTNIAPGKTFVIHEDTTLYAIWIDSQVGPVDNSHTITVNTVSGVSATLSKTKAEAGEVVTLTLSLEEGVILDGDPTSSQVSLTKTGTNIYQFTMIDESVWISVRVKVDGDVVIVGDIATKLVEETQDSGIYVARDVTVPGDKSMYDFSYVINKGQDSGVKKLTYMNLDETKCNASISPVTSKTGNNLSIPGGTTYDFFYDANGGDKSCYIVRKNIDVLPTNEKMLENIFDVKAVGYKNTLFPKLTNISYKKTVNGSNSEVGLSTVNVTYDYKKISDTRSFAKVVDKTNGNKESYVYKDIDLINNVYSVINTYTKTKTAGNHIEGNNEHDDFVWNINPYGGVSEEGYYKPYSAKQDIVSNDVAETTKFAIPQRFAYRNINSAAHTGRELEYEIWESYRGDFDGAATINAANAAGSSCEITSSKMAGGFKTQVRSQLEYNHEESGSTADVTQQYATIYSVDFFFYANGDLASLDYTAEFYSKDKWNFTNHIPKDSVTGIKTTIKADYTYGTTYFDNATTLGTFNPSDYFVSSIDKLVFYNEKTKASKSDTESFVSYGDELTIVEPSTGGKLNQLIADGDFVYSPSTALDTWQYAVTSSGNSSMIGKNPQGTIVARGIGSTTATFTNRTNNSANVSKTINVTITADGTFNSLFFNSTIKSDADCEHYDSYQGEHANIAVGYAGKTMNYYVDSGTNTGAPIYYYMIFMVKNKVGVWTYSGSTPYFNVVNSVGTTHDDDFDIDCPTLSGHKLTVSFNTETTNALTAPVEVQVIFYSNFYKDGFGPTINTFKIYPSNDGVANSSFEAEYNWNDTGLLAAKAVISFTSEGTGSIRELCYGNDGVTLSYTNVYNFKYTEFNNGSIESKVTSVSVEDPSLPKIASAYSLTLEMNLTSGLLGVGLYCEDGDGYILDIFSNVMEDGEGFIYYESLDGFTKVVK